MKIYVSIYALFGNQLNRFVFITTTTTTTTTTIIIIIIISKT
jgi:hypothetical protein